VGKEETLTKETCCSGRAEETETEATKATDDA
jgi:hypothetical protein